MKPKTNGGKGKANKTEYPVTREALTATLVGALKREKSAVCAWEQGAASFGRVDEYSDIDLVVVTEDEGVEATFKAVEKALERDYGIDRRYRMPEPNWHGNSQCFYWVKGASPFLFVDLAIAKESSKTLFLEWSIHGPPKVHFDRKKFIRDTSPKPAEHAKALVARLETTKTLFSLFQNEVKKELARGNDIEALSFYFGMTMRPLVEVLRMKHCPWRYSFNTRYVYYDFPPAVHRRLHGFYFMKDARELARRRDEAEKWFWETVEGMDEKSLLRALKG